MILDRVYKKEEHCVWCEWWGLTESHTINTFMRVISVFRDNNNNVNDANSQGNNSDTGNAGDNDDSEDDNDPS